MESQVTPVLLMILDGWGHGPAVETNAIFKAETPNMDRLVEEYPSTILAAHNGAVGLPEGQMGNSEVGHLNIGAGRVVYQDFTRINRAIECGEFFKNKVLNDVIDQTIEAQSTIHLLGLVSDGGVHSHMDHLIALVKMAAEKGLQRVVVHAFMDGRDTAPTSGIGYISELQKQLAEIGVGKIATISGRFYAMDRDTRWERNHLAWQALVDGKAEFECDDPVKGMQAAYDRGETDEFIKPIVLTEAGKSISSICDGDSVVFFNFRADRARQMVHAMTDKSFDHFEIIHQPALKQCVTFTAYDKDFDLPIAFPPDTLTHILGEEISSHGLKQLRIAETEKYAHVTYFFNGGIEDPFPGEDRALIPSTKEVPTYDLKPEMSVYGVTEELLSRLEDNLYDLIVLNFANGDMVGHTGIMEAAIKACQAVDECVGTLVNRFLELRGVILITADHGNADVMEDTQNHQPFTAHSNNPVPFVVVSEQYRDKKLQEGGALKDIAPTILAIQGLPKPAEMEGENLLI